MLIKIYVIGFLKTGVDSGNADKSLLQMPVEWSAFTSSKCWCGDLRLYEKSVKLPRRVLSYYSLNSICGTVIASGTIFLFLHEYIIYSCAAQSREREFKRES